MLKSYGADEGVGPCRCSYRLCGFCLLLACQFKQVRSPDTANSGLLIPIAFGYLGENATAHDLALGFLLSWLPVIILGSIVDRNPMASEDVRLKLNALMDHVRESLQDPEIRREFVQSFSDQAESERLGMWIEEIARHSRYMDNFFVHFAGQGRVRWHYGAAHPIISDIEDCYIADKGRNWLEHEEEARISLVLGKVKDGLLWFDVRELWQVLSAVTIVLGGLAGAFCLSYFTPTIGLGCRSKMQRVLGIDTDTLAGRSGGYVIFATNSFGLLLLEFLIWWLASPLALVKPPERMRRGLSNSPYFRGIENSSRGIWTSVKWAIASFSKKIDRALVRVVIAVASLAPRHDKEDYLRRLEDRMISKLQALHSQTLQQGTERFFLRPAEIINAGWLFWVSIAQTFGIYRTCDCVTSRWGRGGGYLDFTQSTYTDIDLVKYSWKIGTAIATTSIGFSMSYIVLEASTVIACNSKISLTDQAQWCLQSHLSTENYEDASRGLRKTRYYRRLTMPFRRASRTMFSVFGSVSCWAFKSTKLKFRDQKSLLWTQKITSNRPPVTAHKFSSVSEPAPSIELSYIEGHSPLTDLYRVFSAESDDTSYRPLVQTPEMARQVSSRSFRSDSASFAPSGISPHASPYPSGRVSPQSVQDKSQSESESGLEKSKARAPSRGALEVPTFRVSYTRKTTDEVVHRRQQASPDGIGTDEVAASEDRSTAGVGRQMQEEELLGAGGGLMISYNLDAPSSGEGDGPH